MTMILNEQGHPYSIPILCSCMCMLHITWHVISLCIVSDANTCSNDALTRNQAMEMERNKERFQFLKWGAKAFKNMLIVPPGSGIVHQVRSFTCPK